MNEKQTKTDTESTIPESTPSEAAHAQPRGPDPLATRRESRRWWIKLVVQPLMLLAVGAALIIGLGMAQKLDWISAGSGSGSENQVAGEAAPIRRYICPMMCTPPQTEPGRCPVCAMELVPATSGGSDTDSRSIHVDPVARRVANIRTVAVRSMPWTRTIRAVGELNYDEGSLKTISAYVDGRLDRLYADFTGVVVAQGDQLALVYSPRLYSSQVEFLLAKKARHESRSSSLQRVVQSNRDMHDSARQRLIELGMTEQQIQQLEIAGEANSRLHLCAPISGTVIRKYATEGQYVKEGQAIYELADLSNVWLMLELFPDDASSIRYGQQVEAEVQSFPGRTFVGRVAFIDPTVDPQKRTVGVRVVIPNHDGTLRVGDFAKATIQVSLAGGRAAAKIYDPELANKWISPRHPHVVETSPGKCRVCGIELVPASDFGFASQPGNSDEALAVPRSAVLMAGDNSVVYVETEPGRFEIRRVVLGGRSGDLIIVLEGLEDGEEVAVSGNFLIDSQMQLTGNPSLIDPTKLEPSVEIEFAEGSLPPIGDPRIVMEEAGVVQPLESPPPSMEAGDLHSQEQEDAFRDLSPEDRGLAERQKVCPVADMPLGSMGTPVKVLVEGRTVFICCEGCRERLLADPDQFLAKLNEEAGR